MRCCDVYEFQLNIWWIMSNKKLVIVESPAKARTIKRILGNEFEVTASVGHIRDLPEKSLGIDIEKGFEPQYVVTQPKVVSSLKSVAKNADEIYLAPDPDREGEAIAWHLKEILDSKKSKKTFHRVVFHEITKSAVSKAFEEPGEVNGDLVDAQQARRVLDRLVGYQVSPLLWSKVRRGVSAGRVQSVALRIVCEREREIMAFKPEEYWVFEGIFEPSATPGEQNRFQAKLTRVAGKKTSIHTAEEAERIMKVLADSDSFSVTSVEVKPQKKSAPPPFITSTMQQSAGNLLRMGASQTMSLAQQLYEGIDIERGAPVGLITYMRTDSVAVAVEAQKACRDFVQSEYGAEYVPDKIRNFKSSASAQGAHEAIRPTDVTLTPKKAARFLDNNQLRLYTLIWKRFVASQMSPAIMEKTTVNVENSGGGENCVFQATAVVTKFKGFMVLTPPKEDKEADGVASLSPEIVLGKLSEGDGCIPVDLTKEQKFTEPPPRFSEATLIRELESNGIGRPSTYAAIVRTIQAREYCVREKGKLNPTEIGFQVNDYLVATLPSLFEIGFTAGMEKELDEVENGKMDWREMLRKFYDNLSAWLNSAKYAGAPEKDKAAELISILDAIEEWEPPVKSGRKTYDDKKFFESVRDQFAKDGNLTDKQWTALLRMTVKYKNAIPSFDEFVSKYDCSGEVETLKAEIAERKAANEQRAIQLDSDDHKELVEAFEILAKAEWEEPTKRRGRTYDDKKFYSSLKRQVDQGRVLSEKQLNAFKRIAAKYADALPEGKERITAILKLDALDEPDANAKPDPEVEGMLKTLESVTTWAEPVKKGKRTYDDKVFFESLKEQYSKRKSLTTRQVFALKKMAAKYAK